MSFTANMYRRFWAKVDTAGECWEWTASRTGPGYGQFGVVHGDIRMAHRVAYEMVYGEIPAGLHIDHTCENRGCVNPDHLEAVQEWVNLMRGQSPTAVNHRKTECVSGHALAGDNLYLDPKGRRQCRACRAEAMVRWKQRQVATAA